MTMIAYILEDEKLAANRLIRLLKETSPDVNVVEVFETVEDLARKLVNQRQPDILFLDIQVADGISMELFQIVNVVSKVIFITAYDTYAIEAFRKNATDYLLKPIKKAQLLEAIAKARPTQVEQLVSFSNEYKSRLLVKFGNKLTSLKTSEIAYIFSKNKISYFVTRNGDKLASDFKLQELENMLDPSVFSRANRQFIIHIDSIVSLHRHDASRLKLTLHPPIDQEIVVSTERSRTFKDWLNK